MKNTDRAPTIDVNVDELDRLSTRQQAPLSESDGQKLKTALHAMAEDCWGPRSKTEKLASVFADHQQSRTASRAAAHGRGAGTRAQRRAGLQPARAK